MIEQTYTVTEAAKILKMNRHTLLSWIKKGHIRVLRLKVGRAYRIAESEIKRQLGEF